MRAYRDVRSQFILCVFCVVSQIRECRIATANGIERSSRR